MSKNSTFPSKHVCLHELFHTEKYLTNIKTWYKRNGPKSWFFASLCHHRLATTSVHTHAHRYPLFKSRMKTGLHVNNQFV